jgi:peptide/nickel transport system substrate-binding protein
VCIQEITFTAPRGADATYDSFVNDELDVVLLRDSKLIAEAEDQFAEDDMFITRLNAGNTLMLNNGVNGATPPTADVRVRKAVAMAIDPDVIDERFSGGAGLPGRTLVSEGSALYSDAIKGLPYDVEGARALVDEVKAEGTWDGTIRIMCHDTQQDQDSCLAVEAMLTEAGFVVDKTIDTTANNITTIFTTADYDLVFWGFSFGDYEPFEQLCSASLHGTFFAYQFTPAMTDACDQMGAADTEEERQAAMVEIQNAWNEDVPSVPWNTAREAWIWNPQVHGLHVSLESYPYFGDAWLEQS